MSRRVVQNDGFQRAHDVSDDRNRKLGGCHARPMDTDFDPVATCSCLALLRSAVRRLPEEPRRSAPACSIATRMRISISLSITISLESACEAMTTVPISRACSTEICVRVSISLSVTTSLEGAFVLGYQQRDCDGPPSSPRSGGLPSCGGAFWLVGQRLWSVVSSPSPRLRTRHRSGSKGRLDSG